MNSNRNLDGSILPVAVMNVVSTLPLLILAPCMEYLSTFLFPSKRDGSFLWPCISKYNLASQVNCLQLFAIKKNTLLRSKLAIFSGVETHFDKLGRKWLWEEEHPAPRVLMQTRVAHFLPTFDASSEDAADIKTQWNFQCYQMAYLSSREVVLTPKTMLNMFLKINTG